MEKLNINDKTFNSRYDACKYFKLRYSTVSSLYCRKRKLNSDFTFIDAIKTSIEIKNNKNKMKLKLNGYNSLRDIEKEYGLKKDSISQWMFYHKTKNINAALIALKQIALNKIKYDKKIFDTKAEFAEYLGIDKYSFYAYMYKYRNLSFKEIIEKIKNRKIKTCDYNGKIYKNRMEMCKDLNINFNSFKYYHYYKNASIEEAVEKCLKKRST